MLPFQSRNVRHSEEELSTDDVEVVQHVRNAARVAPSSNKFGTTLRSTGVSSERAPASMRRSPRANTGANTGMDRPQIPAPIPASRRAQHVPQQEVEVFSESDEEMTCLMPSKLILPPASKRGNQHEMRSMEFRPQPQARRAQPMRTVSTPQPMRVDHRQESMISHSDSVIHHHIPAPPASLAPMAMPSVDSGRFNPGATVLTSRSLTGRPTVSWAAALVVMGIFAGLVTAAVARGDLDGDAKVAAASQPVVQQVIPSQQQPASSPMSSPMMGSLYNSGATSSMAVSSPITAAPMMMQQPAAIAQQPVAQQAVAVAAPVAAKFTPAPRVVSHPHVAAAAPVAHVAVAEPKVEVKEAKEEKVVTAKSKKGSKSDDMASAKEAQALADAQLAASL